MSIQTSAVFLMSGPARPAAPIADLLVEDDQDDDHAYRSGDQETSCYPLHHQQQQQMQMQQPLHYLNLVAELQQQPAPEAYYQEDSASTCSTASTCSSDSASFASSSTSDYSSYNPNRVVQFASPPILLEQVREFEREFADRDIPNLWYSRTDIKEASRREKEFCWHYCDCSATTSSEQQPQEQETTNTSSSSSSSSSEEQHQDQDDNSEGLGYMTHLLQIWSTPCSQPDVLQRLVAPIHNSPLRGLEKHVLQQMKARRGIVLQKVLKAQSDLKQQKHHQHQQQQHQHCTNNILWSDGGCCCALDDRDEQLRQACEPLSRTSVRFARAMAQGDAMVVLRQDEEEHQKLYNI